MIALIAMTTRMAVSMAWTMMIALTLEVMVKGMMALISLTAEMMSAKMLTMMTTPRKYDGLGDSSDASDRG